MSTSAGLWNFTYKDIPIEDKDLEDYQQKLIELRDKYHDKVEDVTGCHFYMGQLPPKDNVFARFEYECKRHHPKCTGWFLLWNPNINLNKDKLHSHLHNHCSLWQYKALSKRIQLEIVKDFEKYFQMFDDDDTHPYYIDAYYNLKYGFKTEEDEVPDYTSYSLEEPNYNI